MSKHPKSDMCGWYNNKVNYKFYFLYKHASSIMTYSIALDYSSRKFNKATEWLITYTHIGPYSIVGWGGGGGGGGGEGEGFFHWRIYHVCENRPQKNILNKDLRVDQNG